MDRLRKCGWFWIIHLSSLTRTSCFDCWNFLFPSSSSLGDLKNISILVVQEYPSRLCSKAETWFSARQWLGPVEQCCYWSSTRTCFVRNQLYSVAITLIIPGNITPSESIWGVMSIRVMLILKQSEQQYTLIGKLPTLKCRLGMSWPILWRFHDLIMKRYTLAPSPY